MSTSLVWVGDGAPRMEVAQVEQTEGEFVASGTQLGVIYELRYRLEAGMLRLDLAGQRTLELQLDGDDFFDLGGEGSPRRITTGPIIGPQGISRRSPICPETTLFTGLSSRGGRI